MSEKYTPEENIIGCIGIVGAAMFVVGFIGGITDPVAWMFVGYVLTKGAINAFNKAIDDRTKK